MDTCSHIHQVTSSSGEDKDTESIKTTSTELSQDVQTDILLRQPIKSLVRFKCVCKAWYNLIQSLYFDTLYNRNKKKVSLFCESLRYAKYGMGRIIAFRLSNDVSVEFKIRLAVSNIDMVGCSYGLVCFTLPPSITNDEKYMVCNPFTRIVRVIATPRYECSRSGFVFDPVNSTFKLVRVHSLPSKHLHPCNSVQVDIFMSSAGSWRVKHLSFSCSMYENGEINWGTCVERYMYWTIKTCEGFRDEYFIVCFDMIDEVFTQIELPCNVCYQGMVNLIRYGESLALFVSEKRWDYNFNVWLLNDCDGISWIKQPALRASIDYPYPLGTIRKDEVEWVVLRNHSKLDMWDIDSKYIMCNLNSGETMEFYEKCKQPEFFLYSQSLLPVSSLI